jgi:hypothetical protein
MAQAIDAIGRWEEVMAKESSTPAERKAATWAGVWALFPSGRKSFVLNGKRYRVISNAKVTEIRVTPAPEKKRQWFTAVAKRPNETDRHLDGDMDIGDVIR